MILEKLQSDLKQAQLARDEIRVSTLRLLLSEIKNAQIKKGSGLLSEDIISVAQKEAKRRKEAIEGFRKGGREEQAQKEEAELIILQGYLPPQLTNEELTKIVERTINELGVKSISEMGKVIKAVMEEVAGRSDGGTVWALVKSKLL